MVIKTTCLLCDTRTEVGNIPEKVLVIYTGGTIGSAPRDEEDPESPEIVKDWKELKSAIKGLSDIPFGVDAISFSTPLDSANIGPKHWKAMATIIQDNYDKYIGFVIAHGTDTMVYTASALSFILQNLTKPVVITGSQIPALKKIRNDAEQNLITSLLIAHYKHSKIPCVPEVCIFFRDRLIRGNRCRKIDASGYTAFESPNFSALATAGDRIEINEDIIRKPITRRFEIQPLLDTNVIAVELFPGFQDNDDLIESVIGNERIKGIVLKTYGAGNIPTENTKLLNNIKKAVDRGVFVINVTQCIQGDVQQGLYDTSAVLQDAGVISGQDITPEAALCKLMNIIGNPDLEIGERRKAICRNVSGEQACSMYTTVIDSNKVELDSGKGLEGRYRSKAIAIEGAIKKDLIESALIRFKGAMIDGDNKNQKLRLKIYVNLNATADPEKSKHTLAGSFKKSKDKDNKKTNVYV